MKENSNKSDQASNPDRATEREPLLEITTAELLGKRRYATIIHEGERYRLRVTSRNKLILTK